ncbi:fused DNA-binding response regulator in two-component regulatory system with ZraS: response regulator; sigma54 interaction protein [uncultured Desulfobacterium sp.]|uniref:Fused DNA-binding response regulator in two-component regulatory system with ZraS: response regulator sigma54 interaction protein n=1 Tax=uncultured Desulfobacterium sp. TaxID=201089 RepID=A0A445MVM4_9BACT|nr:fused DNA-binding response regulator in two-component regulatory system with ZraS: response regulator; sigma54 interaction protein [uncultured Desulfobacterium sp.]
MKNLDILVVEDGRSQREMLRDFLRDEGHRVSEAENGKAALEQVKNGYFDLLLVDYKMPEMDGIELIEAVKAINPEIDIIMMTAYGTIETAVNAMKAGAADYIVKPVELEELLIQIEMISERRTLRRENQMLREQLGAKGVTTDQIIYKSAAMAEVVNLAGRVAGSMATVLLEGKSGTGKELLARLIHNLSPRSDRAMITVNCMALSESLLESELFGHEKGAFTGASQQRVGRFEEADQGTLFLDEIGEIPPPIQVKLLRFLQEREFQRVGGNRTLRSDVRIIAATNRNLMEEVRDGSFREDLYYRLNVVTIELPPLRERIEDVPLLMSHFLKRFAERNNKPVIGFSAEARDLLMKYSYPGNVRELENIIERAVVICRENLITRKDLPFHDSAELSGMNQQSSVQSLNTAIENLERKMIGDAMAKASGNQTRAALILCISERMLRYKLKKYGIKK